MIALVVGVVLILAGLGALALAVMGSSNPDAGRSMAQQHAATLAAAIADVERELRHDSVVAAARQVPEDAPGQTAPLVDTLAERGLTELVDVKVFPPRAEEIEVGTYPDPDFTVVQMLVEARRRGVANMRVRHEGTVDEHVAFASAVYDEADEVVAIMLVRMPVETVIGQMTSPGQAGWVRLVQGSRVIDRLPGDVPADAPAAGRQVVDGSALVVEWGVPPARGLSLLQSMMLIVAGLSISILGMAARSGKLERYLERPAPKRPPASSPAPSQPAESPRPATPPPRAADATVATDSEPSESKPDLPDWLLDDGGGPQDLPFGSEEPAPRKQPETSTADGADEDESAADESVEKPSPPPDDGGLELEVPDLDEILAQIDDASETDAAPESSADGQGASGDRGFELPEIGEEPGSADDQAPSGPVPEATPPDLPAEQDLSLLNPDLEVDEESEADGMAADDSALELPDEGEDLIPSIEPESDGASPTTGDAPLEEDPSPSAEVAPDQDIGTQAEPDEQARLLAVIEQSELFSLDLFKTDGIRGIVDRTLDAERAAVLGRAVGTMAASQGHQTVAVGRDGRVSGPVLMSALIRGLRNAGIDVIEAGSVPAPALWYAATEMANGCGVMVSASHHGPSENGMQVMLGGRMLGREQLLEVAGIAVDGEFAEGDGGYVQENAARAYATTLADTVELKRPLKVVIDCGNGIAGNIAPALFNALDLDLIPLYCDVDGSFPNHRPDPTDPECLEDLRLCVRNFRADLGFAFDGDGDQLALVTNDSEVVGADQVLMLLARAMLASEPGAAVVMDVRCSARLGQVVEQAGGHAVLAPAGGIAVARAMVDEDAVLGGDMDGQVIVSRRWYPFGDAICAAVRLLELFADGRQSVQEWLDDLPESRTTGALPVAIDARSGHRLIERLGVDADFGEAKVTTIDGLRVEFPDRWGLVRVSVDDDNVELRFGGHDPAALNRIKADFREWLLAVDPDFPLPY